MDIREILKQVLIFNITVEDILGVILVLLVAKFLRWFIITIVLVRFFRNKQIEEGRRLAVSQFMVYIIYVLVLYAIFEILGLSTMLLASSAALLVGIGLGLQDVFKDLISGIIILIEGTIEVGDVVEIDGLVGNVRKIGLRVSIVETRDRVSILIPNSKLVVDKVTNWSYKDSPIRRFSIKVGVAYGSDLALVKNLLIQAAQEHGKVLAEPSPFIQFKNFGDSSLEVDLLFFSEEFLLIENVKSDIRLVIDRLFRDNEVQIPFPQRDLWLKNPETLKQEKTDPTT